MGLQLTLAPGLIQKPNHPTGLPRPEVSGWQRRPSLTKNLASERCPKVVLEDAQRLSQGLTDFLAGQGAVGRS